jgi:putative ABC transport system substrate-binding protein
MGGAADGDRDSQLWIAAFAQELQRLGWEDGRNIRIDYRWAAGEIDRIRGFATDLVGVRPDVLFAPDTPSVAALRRESSSIPIVFALVADPVGGGLAASLARPGGNVTGFMPVEPPLAGKWVDLLKQVAPKLRRAAFMHNPATAPFAEPFLQYAATVATRQAVELIAAPVYSDIDIDAVAQRLSREPDSGLLVMPEAFASTHRKQIIALAARHRLPAIYPYRYYVYDGGLISYGNDLVSNFRLAASYVDRILRGEQPSELPVQAPTRFETVINLRTAKALGLTIPETLLATADEVIQ